MVIGKNKKGEGGGGGGGGGGGTHKHTEQRLCYFTLLSLFY